MKPITLSQYIARLQALEADMGAHLPIYVLHRTTPLPDDNGVCPGCGEEHDHHYSLTQIVALRYHEGGTEVHDFPCVWLVTADADETLLEPPRFPDDEDETDEKEDWR